MMSDLYVRVYGSGDETILLLHGSNVPDADRNWTKQQALADRYRVLVPDRRGYGQSPDHPPEKSFEPGVRDVLDLLGTGTHVVGCSYGGVLAMLAAVRRPEHFKSLTVIEPPAFGLAKGHPAVDAVLAQLAPVYSAATPEEFIIGFARTWGEELPADIQLPPANRRAIATTMLEPAPWDAPVDLHALAALPFPKLVVSGNWHSAFEATCDVIAQGMQATRAIIPGAGHGVQNTGQSFNDRLEALIRHTQVPRA